MMTVPASRSYFMETARLGFGQWTSDDLSMALGLWGDPAVTKLIGGPFSEDQVSTRLDNEIISQELDGFQYWPIFEKISGEHIGAAGLRWRSRAENTCELGYYLKRCAWGQGYAAEAGQAVVRYSFEVLNFNGLFAGHHPENAASGIVLEKLGFVFTHTELFAPTGLHHPSYLLPPPSRGST